MYIIGSVSAYVEVAWNWVRCQYDWVSLNICQWVTPSKANMEPPQNWLFVDVPPSQRLYFQVPYKFSRVFLLLTSPCICCPWERARYHEHRPCGTIQDGPFLATRRVLGPKSMDQGIDPINLAYVGDYTTHLYRDYLKVNMRIPIHQSVWWKVGGNYFKCPRNWLHGLIRLFHCTRPSSWVAPSLENQAQWDNLE